MPTMKSPLMSAAVGDLGLGDMLDEQVEGETEEMRRKRMQQRAAMAPAGSAAAMSLFGTAIGSARSPSPLSAMGMGGG